MPSSTLNMPIPPEIQDHIIDIFAETRNRSDLLSLRLVCRGWLPRIDFHGFKNLSMMFSEGSRFLSFVKASENGIRMHIRRLSIFSGDHHLDDENISSRYEGYFSLQEYLSDFASSFPYLETLHLVDLIPVQMEQVPCFPSVKCLRFRQTTLTASQLLGLISTASRLETIVQHNSRVLGDVNQGQDVEVNLAASLNAEGSGKTEELIQLSPHLAYLKAYSTTFRTFYLSKSFETVLFPQGTTIVMPSLHYLNLRSIGPESIRVVAQIMRASCRSLRYLRLTFGSSAPLATNGNLWT